MNRKDFNFLTKVVYLDSAAGTLKPNQAINAMIDFYKNFPINPHSTDSKIGIKLRNKIKDIRYKTARLNNVSDKEVIFTNGTTDSLNIIAEMLTKKISQGDKILISYLNHSSNVIVWLELAKRTGAKVIFSRNIFSDFDKKTKIVAISQVNNTLAYHIDMERLFKLTRINNAFLINDAAQAISHTIVDGNLADFTVWSTNKFYGPTGLGILIMKKNTQKMFNPVRFGGGSVVYYNNIKWIGKETIEFYEPGTPNTAAIIMHGEVLKYINEIGFDNIWKHEKEIAEYAFERLSEIKNVKIASLKGDINILFNIKNISSQDVVSYLGHKNIILRAGQHCVNTIYEITGEKTWIRASIALYSSKEDINALINAIIKGGDFLEFI